MGSKLLDIDSILSVNDQWSKLDVEWGNPIDLETEEDQKLSPVFSTLDLSKTTFDSPYIFKQNKRPVKRSLPPPINYNEFLQDLKEDDGSKEVPIKQFYFINGQILSAFSVEEICDDIDNIFKSVEQLCSATSTVRHKKARVERPSVPEVVQCSISAGDLSFDDTEEFEKEKSDSDDIDRFIDEAFAQLNSTIAHISREDFDQSTRGTVTTLVRKFSTMLRSPLVQCSPRRQRRCNDKFRDLAAFWRSKAFEDQA